MRRDREPTLRWPTGSTLRLVLREIIRVRKSLLLGVLCLVAGVFTLPGSSPVGIGLLVLGGVQVLWDVKALIAVRRDTLMRQIPLTSVLAAGPTPYLADLGYEVRGSGAQAVLIDPRVDAALLAGVDARLVLSQERWKPATSAAEDEVRLLVLSERLRARQVIFEDLKIRLQDDPQLRSADSLGDIGLQPCRYTDGLLTNDIADKQLLRRDQVIFNGPHLFTDQGRVAALRGSRLANSIGVSTVAVDPQGGIYLVQQGPRNAVSANMYAPSGSGSADWRDLAATEESLQHLVVLVAERELREELGLTADFRLQTRTTGFGRWIARGGKPEFFCVTELQQVLPASQLTRRERIFTHAGGLERLALPTDRSSAAQALGDLRRDWGDQLALPLHRCLARLIHILRHESAEQSLSMFPDRPGNSAPTGT